MYIWGELTNFDKRICNFYSAFASQIVSHRKLSIACRRTSYAGGNNLHNSYLSSSVPLVSTVNNKIDLFFFFGNVETFYCMLCIGPHLSIIQSV